MTTFSGSLQRALFDWLTAAVAPGTLIAEVAPTGLISVPYILLGEGRALPVRRVPGIVSHDVQLEVVGGEERFAVIKGLSADIQAAIDTPPVLSAGRLVSLRLIEERSVRGRGDGMRRLRLRLNARVAED
jgi:hypothetical protein